MFAWLLCKTGSVPGSSDPLRADDFPALFRAADSYALAQQATFYWVLAAELMFLIAATVISTLNLASSSLAILQAVVLFGALAAAVFLFAVKPDRHWYSARAVAESAKTLTWRYVTRAEPFDTDDKVARHTFRERLDGVVNQNRDVAQRFSTYLAESQITMAMGRLRSLPFDQRKNAYITGRVAEQQDWYARKTTFNNCKAKRSFAALALLLVAAGISAICRVRFVESDIWPTDLFVGLATSVLAWTQAKRFSELAASYSLAAYEISAIGMQADDILDEEALSKFVGDAENAFSREHTQWIARQDS